MKLRPYWRLWLVVLSCALVSENVFTQNLTNGTTLPVVTLPTSAPDSKSIVLSSSCYLQYLSGVYDWGQTNAVSVAQNFVSPNYSSCTGPNRVRNSCIKFLADLTMYTGVVVIGNATIINAGYTIQEVETVYTGAGANQSITASPETILANNNVPGVTILWNQKSYVLSNALPYPLVANISNPIFIDSIFAGNYSSFTFTQADIQVFTTELSTVDGQLTATPSMPSCMQQAGATTTSSGSSSGSSGSSQTTVFDPNLASAQSSASVPQWLASLQLLISSPSGTTDAIGVSQANIFMIISNAYQAVGNSLSSP